MSSTPNAYEKDLEKVNKELAIVKTDLDKKNYKSREMLLTLRRRKIKLDKKHSELTRKIKLLSK